MHISSDVSLKWSVGRDVLLSALRVVFGVVENSQVLQILSNVHFKIKDDSMTLTTSDSEVEVIVAIKLNQALGQDVSLAVSCRKLMDICKSLASDVELSFEYIDSWLSLKAGRANFTLATLPADTFPVINKSDFSAKVILEESQLKLLINKTCFAMAHQDVRFFLNGLHLQVNGGKFIATATDGHRLSRCSLENVIDDQIAAACIVPRKAILELSRLLGESDSAVEIRFADKNISFITQKFTLTATLLDGEYPACDSLLSMPLEYDLAKISCLEFKQVLARAAILSHDKFKGARLLFSKNQLAVSANNAEQEKSEDIMQIDYNGTDSSLAFNINYLTDVLSVVGKSHIWLYLSKQQQSVLLSEPDSDAANYSSIYLIMPLAL